MGELSRTIEERLQHAYDSLRTARHTGDSYLVEVRQAEIEDLRRIAANNDIGVPPPRGD